MGFGWKEAGGWVKFRTEILWGRGASFHCFRNINLWVQLWAWQVRLSFFPYHFSQHHQFSLSLKLQWQIFRIFVFFVTFDRRKNNASTRHNIQQSGCYIIEIYIRVCELKRKWVNIDTLSYVSSEFLVTIPDHYHFTGHSNDSCPTSLAICTL